MFASGILALALSAMVMSFVQCKRATFRMNKHVSMLNNMRGVMERLHAHNFNDAELNLGTHSITNGYYVVSSGPWGTKDVNMKMFWADSLSAPTNVWVTMFTSISSGLHK